MRNSHMAAEMISQSRNHKPAPKKFRSMELMHAENGGYIAEHRFESGDGPYHPPEQHVFGKGEGKKLLAHVAEHMGIKPEAEEKD